MNTWHLFLAIQNGYLHIVKHFLRDYNMNPNENFPNGYNALQLVVKFGYLDIIEYLINIHGMNPNEKDQYKRNALFIAVKFGHLTIIKYLIRFHDMNPNQQYDGHNALYFATQNDIKKYFFDECRIE